MKRLLRAFLVLLAAGLTPVCSSRSSPAAAGLNVLIITLDTTRPDALGLYGNPHGVSPRIDELGRTGLVFENCYTPVPLTLPAHCSLFTGRYPVAHRVRNNGTYVLPATEQTMARVFKDRGYDTAAFVASFTVASKFGLAQGFDVYDEDLETGRSVLNYTAEIPADRVAAKFLRWLGARTGGKFFSWVHFYDAHAPYVPHGGAAPSGDASAWTLYEGEVRYVDGYIGQIVQALKEKGLYETTVLVIVGDHGEGFGEHKERGHGIFCYEETLRVPLVVHNPRLIKAGRTVAGRLSLVDIMPGLLEMVKVPVPSAVQGRSFWPLVDGRETGRREIYFESLFGQEEFHWAPLTGLIDGPDKYISLPDAELYDVDADRRESRNLLAERGDEARAIDRRLAAFVERTAGGAGPDNRRQLSAGDVRALASLGYVSSFSPTSSKTVDPKRGMDLYIQVMTLKDLVAGADLQGAAARLAALEAANPGLELPDLEDVRYQLLKNAGRTQDALELLQKAIARFPGRESFKVFLAMDLIEAGEPAKARDFCRGLIAEDAGMTAAHVLLGDAEDDLGETDAALASYEEAVSLEPQNATVRAKIAALWAKKGDLAKAQTILEGLAGHKAVVDSPDFQSAVSALGHALLASGETARAIAIFRRATDLSPSSPAAWLNLGSAFFSLGNYDAALTNFGKSVALEPGFALGWSNIGQVYLARRVAGDAAAAGPAGANFDKAIALEPKLAAAWNGRASVELAEGRPEQAIRDYARALELDPGLLDAYFNIVLALRGETRYAEALKYLRTCRDRLGSRLPAAEREEIDRLIAEIGSLRGGR